MQIPHQAIHHLKNSKRILVASHINPDGDAIGSLIAFGLTLNALQKDATLYLESPLPAVYRFLQGVERITDCIHELESYDTAVILDCTDFQRIGQLSDPIARVPVIINIDHHTTNSRFGHFRLIDTSACATAEIVLRIAKHLRIPISEIMATAIYTGILTDTGSFRFSNTNQAAFEISEEMVRIGVNPYHVAQQVYGAYSLGRIKLLNLALNTLEISANGMLSLMTVTRKMLEETGTRIEDVDGLINYAKSIRNVKVAALILEKPPNGRVIKQDRPALYVSLRSDASVDVAQIAASYGGGGHPTASGFSVEAPLSKIKNWILTLAERF